MFSNKTAFAMPFVLAASLLGAQAALGADTGEVTRDPYRNLHHMKVMDTDKDGMVSKAEFMAMAGKAFDMHAKEMQAKGGKMTQAQIDELTRRVFGAGFGG